MICLVGQVPSKAALSSLGFREKRDRVVFAVVCVRIFCLRVEIVAFLKNLLIV